jgi:predicted acylesterase/phospholipase RssA
VHHAGVSPTDTSISPRPGDRGPARSFKVLSLAGGGFLGLYTASVLEALEARVGRPLGRSFDLIAGTSIGGILALALAFEVPMARLTRLFEEHGAEVFSSRALPSGPVSKLMDLTRSVLGPKYSGDALRAVLAAELGGRTLDEALHALVIPAVEVDRCRTKVFKTPHGPASRGDGSLQAVDVALAASAAPAYFPSHRIGERLYADGGLFAVAPDQVALHEAEHFMGVDLSRVSMLSIGTGTAHYRPADGVRDDAGAIGWLTEGRLVLTLISVQQQHVQAMVEDRLGDRYLRLDADWPADGGLGIDVATREAKRLLRSMARRTLRETDPQVQAKFLD